MCAIASARLTVCAHKKMHLLPPVSAVLLVPVNYVALPTDALAELARHPLEAKLKPALKRLEGSQYWQPRFSRAKYYAFAHRVCRAYRQLWSKQKRDPAHLNRENLARSAVASVFGQVRPWTDKPHHGNTHMAMLTLLPAIETVFDIPSYDHNPGTKQWLKKMVTTNRSVRRVHFCNI